MSRSVSLLSVVQIVCLSVALSVPDQAKSDDIYVKNQCFIPIRIAIRYLDENTETWTTAQWWSLSPSEGAFLASQGSRLQSKSNVIYYYAAANEYGVSWRDDQRKFVVDGDTFGFRRHQNRGFDVDLKLTCEKLIEPIRKTCSATCAPPPGGCLQRSLTVEGRIPGEPEWNSRTGFNRLCLAAMHKCHADCVEDGIERWKEEHATDD